MTNLQKRNNKFEKAALEAMPGYMAADGYFLLKNCDDILSGFCVEESASSHGFYIWLFVYPLFHKFDDLNFLYSSRLPGGDGFVDSQAVKDSTVFDFLDKLSRYRDVTAQCVSIDGFIRYISKRPDILANKNAELGLAFALLLSGETETAIDKLQRVSSSLKGIQKNSCDEILSALLDGSTDLAVKKLGQYKSEMMGRVGWIQIK